MISMPISISLWTLPVEYQLTIYEQWISSQMPKLFQVVAFIFYSYMNKYLNTNFVILQ